MKSANKACPVVLRGTAQLEVLVFRHPLAGIQLVKGSIEPGETPAHAALRELREEAGIRSASISRDLGVWFADYQGQIWSFHLCNVDGDLPNHWAQPVEDDGGHVFEFFWHPLADDNLQDWHGLFRGALGFIRDRL